MLPMLGTNAVRRAFEIANVALEWRVHVWSLNVDAGIEQHLRFKSVRRQNPAAIGFSLRPERGSLVLEVHRNPASGHVSNQSASNLSIISNQIMIYRGRLQ